METLERLQEVVEGLEIGLDGDQLAHAHQLLDQLAAKVNEADGAFDAAELWDQDNVTSMVSWLRHRCHVASNDAARAVSSAKRLRGLPLTSAAALDGRLSAGQLNAILANVSDATAALLAEHEAEVLDEVIPLSPVAAGHFMRHWKAMAEDALDLGEPRPEPESSLHLSPTFGGRWRLDANLSPLSGEILATALRLAEGPDTDAEPSRTPAQRRVDALDDICRFFLNHREHPAGSRHRPHVNVIVRLEDLDEGKGAEFADGVDIDGPSLASLVCDSVWHRVLTAGSAILDYGTSTRAISANLFNALIVRDRQCRFPGCDRPPAWTEAHHLVHVGDGGATCLSNLCLVCSRHHHRLHRPGWSAKLEPDGELVVTDPDGRVFTSRPPSQAPRPPPDLFAA